jgi:hypothetical protein
MILSSHGIIGSSIVQIVYDADAQAFFDRVTTAGGSLSLTEKQAVNQLVLDLKANSLWTPMKAIYPMVGASAAACAQNLKSSSFTGSFTSGWTFASTGVTPNGTSAYMDSNCQVSSQITRNSGSFGMYFNTDRAANQKLHGAYSSSNLALVGLYPRYSGNVFYAYLNTQDGVNPTTTPSNTLGLRAISRTSSTNNIIQVNSTQTTKSQLSLGDVPLNFYIGACNTNGTATDFDSIRIAFTYLSLGLDSTQMANLYTNIQAFQTTLSRQV